VKPIRVKELKGLREVGRYFTVSSSKGRQLDVARSVVEAIWDEHEATANGDVIAARSALSVALKLEPNNMYPASSTASSGPWLKKHHYDSKSFSVKNAH
jgi:spermidine synthase